jgi:hypothetical protein
VRNPSWASPGLGRRCGDRAMVEKLRQRGKSTVVVLELRGRGEMRGGVRKMAAGVASFYKDQRAVGRGGGRRQMSA